MQTKESVEQVRSRAINFLDEFIKEDGSFTAFLDFVKNHDELELLFRGNSGDNGEVIIYYKNNIVWKLSKNSESAKVTINYNHLRYCVDWEDKMKQLHEYGFPIKYPVEKVKKVKGKERRSYESDYVSVSKKISKNEKFEMDFVAGTYEIIKEVMSDYFYCNYENGKEEDVSKLKDYFREYLGVTQSNRKKPNYCEKENQQKFFSCNSSMKNGVFVYDLEYKEPHKDKAEKETKLAVKKREKMNKPDCFGIRFDEERNPIKFVMIEIKSKAGSESGSSGTKEHLDGMMDDLRDKDFVKARLIEAKEIMEQYRSLGLKGLSKEIFIPDFSQFADKIGTEILVVYTDELADSRMAGTYVTSSEKYGEIEYQVEVFRG